MDSRAFLFFDAGPLAGWLAIVLADLVLSADNAMAVAMAARSIAPEKRLQGIILGTLGAVCLRVGLAWYAAQLMQTPFLKLAGGAVILWIAVKVLVERPGAELSFGKARTPWQAFRTILIADATMSLDNVLAAAGISGGDPVRLWTALGVAIPLMISACAIFSALMERFPVLLYAGAAVLAKTGGGMIVSDSGLAGWWLPQDASLKLPAEILAMAAVFVAAFRLRRGSAARPARALPDEQAGP